jgi:CHAT domain-containing protein
VSDEATAELMDGLYADSGQTASYRLHQCQLTMLAALRADGRTDHPYFWAPFISVGKF